MKALRSYCSLATVKERNQIPSDADDSRIFKKMLRAATMIDEFTHRTFEPVQKVQEFDWHSAIRLYWDAEDLLSLTSIVDSNCSGSAISLSDLTLLGNGPYWGVEREAGSFSYSTSKKKAIAVTGVWGWHDDYANAWHSSGDALTEAATSSATSLSVSDTQGADTWGQSPRLSAGQLIQVESEWMYIVATETTTLTLVRGVNGTTAAAHDSGKAISVYEPPLDIAEVCSGLTALLMARDDTELGKVIITATGDKVIPTSLPRDFYDALIRHQKARVR